MSLFQQQQSREEGSANYSYHQPVFTHHPWRSTCLYGSSSGAKVAEAASGEEELKHKVCEFTDAPVAL